MTGIAFVVRFVLLLFSVNVIKWSRMKMNLWEKNVNKEYRIDRFSFTKGNIRYDDTPLYKIKHRILVSTQMTIEHFFFFS